MRVLVTGGAGYIGSHTVWELTRSGHEPVVLDDLSRGHRGAVPGAEFIHCDLRDATATARAVAEARCEAVVHFASLAYVGESVGDPARYYSVNLLGGFNLLEAMRAVGVKRIVFSSSCTVYGVPASVPIAVSAPLAPISPYGHTKAAMEAMLKAYADAYGFEVVCLRYFNAAGAHVDGSLGEDHTPETHLIPNAIFAASGRGPALQIFGTDYPTEDGTCVRDYVHVMDLATAHASALATTGSPGSWLSFNLGTGQGVSVKTVIEMVTRVAGVPVPVVHAPRRPGDPPALVADVADSHDILGWAPAHSDLETIVETAWSWHQRHPRGFASEREA